MLCTIDDIKLRLGLDSTHDALLTQLVAGFTRAADTFCNRVLLVTAADVTDYYTGGSPLLQLRRYPVVAISSIKECLGYNFDDVAPLVADTDYRLVNPGDDNRGILLRLYVSWNGNWDGIQVKGRGGYCAAGVTPQTGEVALPDDLREAAIQQCSFLFKRRDDIGLSGVSFDGGSFDKSENLKLLPGVAATLTAYRRL
jgi:hypothetical protein